MILNEQQNTLVEMMVKLLQESDAINTSRVIRDSRCETGFDTVLWQQLLELGVPATALPESCGGLGCGYLGLGAVCIEMGKHLAATPMLSTVVLAAPVFAAAGDCPANSRSRLDGARLAHQIWGRWARP